MNKSSFLVGATALLLASSIAFPAFAETGMASSTGHQKDKPAKVMDLACVQTAVDVREGAIGTAFGAFSTSQAAALAARKTALHDAWGMTDGTARRAARNKAWSDYRTTNKTAHDVLRTARKATWSAFETASKACKVPVVETANGEGSGSLGL